MRRRLERRRLLRVTDPRSAAQATRLLEGLLELADARVDDRIRRDPFLYGLEGALGVVRVGAQQGQRAVDLNPRFARVLHPRAVELEPVAQSGRATVLLRRVQ